MNIVISDRVTKRIRGHSELKSINQQAIRNVPSLLILDSNEIATQLLFHLWTHCDMEFAKDVKERGAMRRQGGTA